MSSKKRVCIVVDLRTGQHVARIPDLVAVLAAAGWKTTISLKEYGGETQQLARKAAQKKYDLVIGFGGDGTLNAVLNGVMYAHGKSPVADIPGGTFNVWAKAVGVPEDPVKAALTIVESAARSLDLGHVEVAGLLPGNATENSDQTSASERSHKKPRRSEDTRQYFLLNIGIGMDALMMEHISKPLKYEFGSLAFDVAALKALPHQHPFPVRVEQFDERGNIQASWQGDVWQVYVSKVPLFGGSINIEPGSRADDGLLYVCLITANGPLKTMEQLFSFFAKHVLDQETTHYLQGKHFSIRIPASIAMHVDGSIVRLPELLHKADRELLEESTDADQLLVDYRFDIKAEALQIAIPRAYDGPLFEKPARPLTSSSKHAASQAGKKLKESSQQAKSHSQADRQVVDQHSADTQRSSVLLSNRQPSSDEQSSNMQHSSKHPTTTQHSAGNSPTNEPDAQRIGNHVATRQQLAGNSSTNEQQPDIQLTGNSPANEQQSNVRSAGNSPANEQPQDTHHSGTEHPDTQPAAGNTLSTSRTSSFGYKKNGRPLSEEERQIYAVTVIGTAAIQDEQPLVVVAGHWKKEMTDETEVVAVRVDERTMVLNEAGEQVAATRVLALEEGQKLTAQGNKTKRNVIEALCVRLVE